VRCGSEFACISTPWRYAAFFKNESRGFSVRSALTLATDDFFLCFIAPHYRKVPPEFSADRQQVIGERISLKEEFLRQSFCRAREFNKVLSAPQQNRLSIRCWNGERQRRPSISPNSAASSSRGTTGSNIERESEPGFERCNRASRLQTGRYNSSFVAMEYFWLSATEP